MHYDRRYLTILVDLSREIRAIEGVDLVQIRDDVQHGQIVSELCALDRFRYELVLHDAQAHVFGPLLDCHPRQALSQDSLELINNLKFRRRNDIRRDESVDLTLDVGVEPEISHLQGPQLEGLYSLAVRVTVQRSPLRFTR